MIKAELILHNANIVTMNPRQPRAQALAVGDGRIVRAGLGEDLESLRGRNTRVIDCRGKTVVPGFIDAHLHFFALAASRAGIDCSPASVSSIADIQALLHRQAQRTAPGAWIRAYGYNEFYLAEKRHPNRWDLDQACPDHPVRLTHRSLYASVLNSLALKLAGIARETPDPPNGIIDRDWATAEPTGLLLGMNAFLSEKVVPPLTEAELAEGVKLANRELVSGGITSFTDATVSNDLLQWQAFRRLKESGELKPRISMMAGIQALDDFLRSGMAPGFGDDELKLGAVKIVVDETSGRLQPSQPELNEMVLRVHRAGFQVALHAIEETTVEAAALALEHSLSRSPGKHRHRIEHCSVCPPPLLERLKALKVTVVTQPSFLFYSGERYRATVPESQFQWLYRIRSFVDAGLAPAASSDAPVVPPDPLIGIYAAVTRKAETGQAIVPEEAIPVTDALSMYSRAAARAGFEEKVKGVIAPGKLADLAILGADPATVSPEEIAGIRVEKTVIGGRLVWGEWGD